MSRPSREAKSSDTPASSSAKSTGHEKFATRWKNFEASFKGLSEISQYINAMEVNMDKVNRLETELGKKDMEISTQQIGRQQMLQGFAEESQKWQEKESRLIKDLQNAKSHARSLEDQLAKLKSNSTSNESFRVKIKEVEEKASQKSIEAINEKAMEIQKLKKALEGSEKTLKKMKEDFSKQSTLLVGSEVQLRSCQADLEERRAETGLEELSADFASMLMNLSMKFHEFARDYFFTTLPKDVDADYLFIELQRSRFMREISRSIPISNTKVSKYLRMAAAESIIARNLARRIFQPLYIVDPLVKDGLENVLDSLFTKNARQGSILRSLLLAAYTAEGNIGETRVLNAVVTETRSILNPLLFDQFHSDTFATELGTLLREALDLWIQAQKSPTRVLASTEGKFWDWGYHEEHNEAKLLTAAQAALVSSSDEPVITLFPRVFYAESSVVLHPGFSLWSDQGIVVAGELEVKDQVARVNSRNGKINGVAGRRRISISNSPTNLSFHQRMNSHSESTHDRNAGRASVIGSVNEIQPEGSVQR